MSITTFEPPIQVQAVVPLNRRDRRATVKHKKGQRVVCQICGQHVAAKDLVSVNEKATHQACIDRHNERAVEMAQAAVIARAQAGGLILPERSLLVPPHAARR